MNVNQSWLALSNSDEFKEADASERFSMLGKKKTPTSNLQRLLMEFPWLWAVRQEWSEGDEINVGNAGFRLLKFGFSSRSFNSTKVWVVAGTDDSTIILPVIVRFGWCVNLLFKDLPTAQHRVTHVVLDELSQNNVHIFRVPAGLNSDSARDYIGNE